MHADLQQRPTACIYMHGQVKTCNIIMIKPQVNNALVLDGQEWSHLPEKSIHKTMLSAECDQWPVLTNDFSDQLLSHGATIILFNTFAPYPCFMQEPMKFFRIRHSRCQADYSSHNAPHTNAKSHPSRLSSSIMEYQSAINALALDISDSAVLMKRQTP